MTGLRSRRFAVPIRKRGKTWSVDIYLPNGKRYRKTVGTREQAEEVEEKIAAEIVNGKWSLREKDITFGELLPEYFEYSEASKAETTHSNDKYRIEAHLLLYFGKSALKDITPKMIDRYKAKRIRDRSPDNKVSNNTVNHELVCLSHIFKMAVRWGYAEKNPVLSVEKLKVARRPPRYLSLDEIERLLYACRGTHIYPIVMTALHTGMRKSELFNLQWPDIDFAQRKITIQSKKDWHTKNYKPRTVFITPSLYEMLEHHKIRFGDNDYVFTYNGSRIKYSIDDALSTAVEKARLKSDDRSVTLHTLRHTYASQLAIAGVPLRDIQELMGHQSSQTTLQYAHLSEEHMGKQVLKLPYSGDEEIWSQNGHKVLKIVDIPPKNKNSSILQTQQ
jgi:integrase